MSSVACRSVCTTPSRSPTEAGRPPGSGPVAGGRGDPVRGDGLLGRGQGQAPGTDETPQCPLETVLGIAGRGGIGGRRSAPPTDWPGRWGPRRVRAGRGGRTRRWRTARCSRRRRPMPTFSGAVTASGGRTVAVQPGRQMVTAMSAWRDVGVDGAGGARRIGERVGAHPRVVTGARCGLGLDRVDGAGPRPRFDGPGRHPGPGRGRCRRRPGGRAEVGRVEVGRVDVGRVDVGRVDPRPTARAWTPWSPVSFHRRRRRSPARPPRRVAAEAADQPRHRSG